MVEPMMFFGLGFLAACLIALIIIPLVHARAVRLTTRRIQASAPISIAQIQSDKDQLRAEFAMSTRRLEMSVEQLKEKTTAQLADLGRRAETIVKLKSELADKTAIIAGLEERHGELQNQLQISEEERTLKANALQEAERKLQEREEQYSKLGMNLEEKSATADGHRIEIVALRTQIATLRDKVADLERDLRRADERVTRERASLETTSRELGEERAKVERLSARATQLEQQVASRTTEATDAAKRLGELEASHGAQGRAFEKLGRERDQLRQELDALRHAEQTPRAEGAGIAASPSLAAQPLPAGNGRLEEELEQSRRERAALQAELASLKRQAESSWQSERMENALLRERINDVSAEVARLMVTLEGADSPIEAILMQDGGNGAAPDAKQAAKEAEGMQNGTAPSTLPRDVSLADRIRALQSRAGRGAPAN